MFDNIIGHEDKKAYFGNIIQNKNISHSYIFYGNNGVGKATFAKELAKLILNVDNLDTCPDYKYIAKTEDKKEISVEQIRKEIVDDVYIAPISNEYKVYIIDDAQNLNIASQNSLLKTLEEPPKYVVMIIVSDNINTLLTTILSRANQIHFTGISNKEIIKYASSKFNINVSNNVLEYIEGSLGKLIEVVENDYFMQFESIDKLVNLIVNKDTINSLILAQNIKFSNNDIIEYFENSLYTLKKYSSVKYVEKAVLRLKNNGNYDITIDNMIIKIIDEI